MPQQCDCGSCVNVLAVWMYQQCECSSSAGVSAVWMRQQWVWLRQQCECSSSVMAAAVWISKGPSQKFAEAQWNEQNSFGRVRFSKRIALWASMVFCIHIRLRVEVWRANFCLFWGEGGVSSETNFVRFAGLLRTFAMTPEQYECVSSVNVSAVWMWQQCGCCSSVNVAAMWMYQQCGCCSSGRLRLNLNPLNLVR